MLWLERGGIQAFANRPPRPDCPWPNGRGTETNVAHGVSIVLPSCWRIGPLVNEFGHGQNVTKVSQESRLNTLGSSSLQTMLAQGKVAQGKEQPALPNPAKASLSPPITTEPSFHIGTPSTCEAVTLALLHLCWMPSIPREGARWLTAFGEKKMTTTINRPKLVS